jgi:hypothetical protein
MLYITWVFKILNQSQFNQKFQSGTPRSSTIISEQLDEQIRLSMYGVESPITKLQTATGTKDPIAQYWIDILLSKARELKAARPDRSCDDIATELREWFNEQPGDKKNPLLSVLGKLLPKMTACKQ